jgi:hypothetical protein
MTNGKSKKSEETTTNVEDLLLGLSKPKTETVSKSKIVVIDKKELYPVVDSVVAAYKAKKNAEADFGVKEKAVLMQADEWYKNTGGVESSVKFKGTEEMVTVTYSTQFSAVPIENKKMIAEQVGDKINVLFTETRNIKFKDPTNERISGLIKLLGDKFGDYFEVDMSLKPTAAMAYEQFKLSDSIRSLIKQPKASVKL